MVLGRVMFAAAAVSLAACAPDVTGLRAEIYELCYEGVDVRVDRVAPDRATGALVIDDVELTSAELTDPRVTLAHVTLHAGDGISDFAFVDTAHIAIVDEPLVQLAPTGAAALHGEGSASVNLLRYMSGDAIPLTVVFRGEPPGAPWRVRADACFDIDGVTVEP